MIRHFKKLLEQTGLHDMRFCDFRHTAASQMLINGVDILTITKRLGHSKSSVTLDTYGHLIPGAQEKAAEILDDIVTSVAIYYQKTPLKMHRDQYAEPENVIKRNIS